MKNLDYYQQQLDLIESHNAAMEAEILRLRNEYWTETKRLCTPYLSFTVRKTKYGFRIDWQRVIYREDTAAGARKVKRYDRITLNRSSKSRPNFRQNRKIVGNLDSLQSIMFERYDPILAYYRELALNNENLAAVIHKMIDLVSINEG